MGAVVTELRPEDTVTYVMNPNYRGVSEGKPFFGSVEIKGGGERLIKKKNRERVDEMVAAGRLRVLLNSNVKAIGEKDVTIDCGGSVETIRNDAVVISAGGILPSGFLRSVGIEVETKFGTA